VLVVALLLATGVRDADANARARRAKKGQLVKGKPGPVEESVFDRGLVSETVTAKSILEVHVEKPQA
jgi:hypothetical protein